jgi:hypothetical protein
MQVDHEPNTQLWTHVHDCDVDGLPVLLLHLLESVQVLVWVPLMQLPQIPHCQFCVHAGVHDCDVAGLPVTLLQLLESVTVLL